MGGRVAPEVDDVPRERDAAERAAGHRAADGTLKRGFETKAQAKKYLKGARYVSHDMDVYRCRLCPNWHLGKHRPAVSSEHA